MADVYTRIGYIKGDKGDTGATGAQGVQGEAATINVGSVSTTAYGNPAQVVNVGTENDAILNFTIPQGAPGQRTTTMSGLTLDTVTTSTDEFPVPAVGENGSTVWGKVIKFFGDVVTALTGKLDANKVVNSQAVTESGYALDAQQANPAVSGSLAAQISTLNDSLANMGAFIAREAVTTSLVTQSLGAGKKFSDYVVLAFIAQINGTVRGSLWIPVSKFSDGQDCYVVGIAGTTVTNMYIKYVSDTSFSVKCDDSRFNYISIYGG